MLRAHRASTTAVLIVCLLGATSSEIFASESAGLPSPSADTITTATEDVSTISPTAAASEKPLPVTTEFLRSLARSPLLPSTNTLTAQSLALVRPESNVFAQRGYGRRGYSGRNSGAAAAMFIGAAAAIAGTALLVYANRPECSTRPTAGGCGYGTKVVGGAVLAGGAVGVVVGAATWR
jgi:hypothetical protein